jgi:hypothetical protein
MTPVDVRTKLVHTLGLDLIGPDRDSELLNEVLPQAPSRWYLTGFLVPIDAEESQRTDETANEGMDEQSDAGGTDDATTPEPAAARRAVFPSSMGLSLLVPKAAKELRVTVRWGNYRPPAKVADGQQPTLFNPTELSAHQGKLFDPQDQRGWKRTERVEEMTLQVLASQKPAEYEVPNSGELKVALSVRPVRDIAAFEGMVPKGTRSVSVFLVNRRKLMPDEERDIGYAFQAALEVRCEQPFVSRPNLRGLDSKDWDERLADLQYRDVCEFAVGHGISTRAVLDEKGYCQEVHTRWIPAAEVERVAAAPIAGVELAMEKLAGLPDGAAAKAGLSDLVTHYRTWIEKQKANVPAKPLQRKVVADDLLDNRAMHAAKRIEEGIELLQVAQVLDAFRIANKVMAVAARRRFGVMQGKDSNAVPAPAWRPFQIAFILMNLKGIAEPTHVDRAVVAASSRPSYPGRVAPNFRANGHDGGLVRVCAR